MTNRFLISVAAAALIAGTGFANAQGTGTNRETPSAGSNVQQNAPSSERGGTASGTMHRDSGTTGMKGAESIKGSDSKDMKASESRDKQPSSKSAQDTKGEKSKSMIAIFSTASQAPCWFPRAKGSGSNTPAAIATCPPDRAEHPPFRCQQ